MVGAGLSLAAAEEDIRARKRRGESLGQALLIGGGLGLANAAASFVAPAKVGAVTAKLVKWLPRAVEAGLVAGPSLAAAQNIIAGKGTINDFKLLSGAISMGGKAGIKRGRSAQAKSQIKDAIKEGELQVNKPSEAAVTATGSTAARPTPVFKGKLQQGENLVDKDFTVSEAVREQAKLPNVRAEDMIKAVKEDLKAQGAVIDDTTTAAKLLDAIGYKATKNGGIEAVKAPKATKVDSPKVSIFKKWLPKNWNRLKDEDILAVLNDEVQSDALVELTMGEKPAINPRALAQFISQHQNEGAVKNFLKRHPMENASTTTAGRLFTYKYKFASDGKAAAARTVAETAQKAAEETVKTAEETTKKAVETPKIETPAPKVEVETPKVETPEIAVEAPKEAYITPRAQVASAGIPSLREIISKKSENAFPGIKAPVAVAAPQAPNVPVAVMSPYSRPAASATTTAFHLGESSPAASRAYRAPKTVVIENQAQLTDGSGKYTPALWVSPDGNVTITRAEAPKSPVKKTGVKAVEKKPLPKKETSKEAPKEKKVNPKKAAKAAGKAASAEKNAKGKGKKMREYKDGGTLITKYAGGGTNVTGLNYDPISLKSWLNKESLNNAARRGAEYQHKAADAALYADVTPTVNAGRMMAESAITPYKQAALNTRAKIGSTMTADSRLNRAMDINYEKAATGYDVQSNAALSNAKDRYAAAVNQAEQKNDALQAEAANKLLARQAQVSASHSEIDAGLNQQIAGNNHAWRQQQLQKASDIKAKLNELEMNKATQEEYVRQMDLVTNAAKEARNAYDQWVTAYKAQGLNPAEKYADFDAWYEKSPDAEPYKNVGKAAKAQAQMVGLDTAINRYRNDLNRASIIPWHKNGGSTSTYRHKQPMETMAENAHKANLKAVEGFNRQIFRMLNDLLKV